MIDLVQVWITCIQLLVALWVVALVAVAVVVVEEEEEEETRKVSLEYVGLIYVDLPKHRLRNINT